MQATITIPDAYAESCVSATCVKYNYESNKLEGETQKDFAFRMFALKIMEIEIDRKDREMRVDFKTQLKTDLESYKGSLELTTITEA